MQSTELSKNRPEGEPGTRRTKLLRPDPTTDDLPRSIHRHHRPVQGCIVAARPGRRLAWVINEAITIVPKNLPRSTPRKDFSWLLSINDLHGSSLSEWSHFKTPGPQRMRAWHPFAWSQNGGTAEGWSRASGIYHASYAIMSVPTPETTENDWVRRVLFEQGYLAKIPGEAIKVYLTMIEACGGLPDRSVTISLKVIMRRTQLSCPTVIESLARLEELGLVVSTTRQRGKVKTYYVADPPAADPSLERLDRPCAIGTETATRTHANLVGLRRPSFRRRASNRTNDRSS